MAAPPHYTLPNVFRIAVMRKRQQLARSCSHFRGIAFVQLVEQIARCYASGSGRSTFEVTLGLRQAAKSG